MCCFCIDCQHKSPSPATVHRSAPVWLSMRFFADVCTNKNSILYAHTHSQSHTHAPTHIHTNTRTRSELKKYIYFHYSISLFPLSALIFVFSLSYLFTFFLQCATCCKQLSLRISNMYRMLHSCKWAMWKNDWLMAA